ncbi:MAG: LTA synthase family protein [Elusimicrobia bacterium]|nr:LTA synthase family protein [Elusimicrobiota bacterium]
MIKKIVLLLITFVIMNLITIAYGIYKLGLLNLNLDIITFLRYNFDSIQILPFINIIFYLIIIFTLFLIIFKFTKTNNYYKSIFIFFSIILLLGTIKLCITYKVFYYISHKLETSDFYEKHYVDAKQVSIQVPKQKKNLILIFMESMEFTFADNKFFKENLIPELTKLSNENISFNKHLQGYFQNNTQMSLVATMTGIPSRAIFIGKNFGNNEIGKELKEYLPNIYSLPDILKDNGYNTMFIQSGDVDFAGARTFLQQHSFDFIMGEEELSKCFSNITKNEWGVEDKFTFETLKKELLQNYKTDIPFFFTIFTTDTHFNNNSSITESKNKIKQTSILISDFINWCNKQNFIKDTTIIIIGDHLRMKDQFISEYYDKRYIYNCFINSVYTNKNVNKNRTFSQIDLFPTILEALGFKIEGSKLGLGTSLFSDKKTLLEEFGEGELNSQLAKRNKIYNNLWKSK